MRNNTLAQDEVSATSHALHATYYSARAEQFEEVCIYNGAQPFDRPPSERWS